MKIDIILKIIKNSKFIITIVDPVGVSYTNESNNPEINEINEIIVLIIITVLNLSTICIVASVGNIIKLEIRSAPINLIPITITNEQIIAKIILYKFVLIPIDLANFSSKVIKKILL